MRTMTNRTAWSFFGTWGTLLVAVIGASVPVQAQTLKHVRPTAATSSVNSGDAANTIDQSANFLQTFWQAAGDPEACITYDLGHAFVVLAFRESSGGFPANPFTAFVSSDDVSYTPVVAGSLTQNSVATHAFSSVSARYIKLCIQRTDETGFGELVDFRAL